MNRLKKILYVFFVLLLTTNIAQSQNEIGFKLGFNAAKWAGDTDVFEGDNKSAIGLNTGLLYNIKISESLSIQPELLLIQKGTKIEFNFGGQTAKLIVRMNYLELPVLVKMNFPINETMDFFANAGPSLGYALSGNIISKFDGETDKEEIEFDDDGFARVDFSLAVGGGFGYTISSGKLIVDLRYLIGLSNLDDGEAEENFKNRGFGLTVGYVMPL